MQPKFSVASSITLLLFCSIYLISCSKESAAPPVTPPDVCAGKTITLSITQTAANCTSNGSITVTASGSTGFTYKLNAGGLYQASSLFNNLAGGPYTVFAKDADGCEKSVAVTVASASAISVTATTVSSAKCDNNGSITVTATGGTSYTYKLNSGGAYQSSNVFSDMAPGSYTVFAKDLSGCENSATVAVATNTTAGPLFTDVKSLIAIKCQVCHSGPSPTGGLDFTVDCVIVDNATRINQRAVIDGTMPQGGSLTAAEKARITSWINAGGKFSN